MRGLPILVLLVLVLPTTQPGPSSSFGEGSFVYGVPATSPVALNGGGLLITEVCPGHPTEYVVITNHGTERSINGSVVSDGEGNVTIRADIVIGGGGSIALCANRTSLQTVRPGISCLEEGSPELDWGGRFALADPGDEVMLLSSSGELLDLVVYGSSGYSGPGWSGPAVDSVPKSHALVRGEEDHDSSVDWSVEPPGRSKFPSETFEAIVEPFSAPENAKERLVREIGLASRTVNCSIYELSDPVIVTALARCARRGVDVNVLIEGQPVGGLSNASLQAVATLQSSQVTVKELRSNDSYKRYDYVHAKYMVLDGRRVVVMSENWGSGLCSNRGWGVCLDGTGVAGYFDGVFEEDFSGLVDVIEPVVTTTVLEASDLPTSDLEGLTRSRCQVTALLSPDNSEQGLHDLIAGATRTILVEQMSVEKDWLQGSSLLRDLIVASARGVEVRLLMDTSWGGGDNGAVAKALNDMAAANRLDLEAKLISDYHGLSVMHNKGLIVDDAVVVSSINWGDSALNENREAGVIVRSSQVSSFFSSLFWSDWSIDPIPPVARLPWTYLQVNSGELAFLDASLSSDNAGQLCYEWDIDGDSRADNTSSNWAVRLPEGNHTIVLTVRDRGNNTCSTICWVEVRPASSIGPEVPIVLLAVPLLLPVGVLLLKRIIGRKRY